MKITPVLVVDKIEPVLPFWQERMGFESVVQVPNGDQLGFVMLARNGAELMVQTAESVRKDEPAFAPEQDSTRTSLFIEVDDWDDTVKRLAGYPVAMPERTTFYGMREIGVFDPAGNVVIFAVKAAGESAS